MYSLADILKRKLRQPRFAQIVLFGKIKQTVQNFFHEQRLYVSVGNFDQKTASLTLFVAHPGVAREVITYQSRLNTQLKECRLPTIKKLTTRIRRQAIHL